jgi:hypothetical protein
MQTKAFHLSDILSITTSRLVSNRGMEGVHDILSFMAGHDIWTHQIPRVMKDCEPWLKSQFPALSTPEMEADICAMCDGLEGKSNAERESIISTWLKGVADKHGWLHDVQQLPPNSDGPRDPIQEAQEMFGADRVVPVVIPE